MISRRSFLQSGALAGVSLVAGCKSVHSEKQLFEISLAEWSLNKALFGKKMTHMDFPLVARVDYDIDAIELVNQFFMDKARDTTYLADFKRRAQQQNVRILLIMCDDEGALGDPDPALRRKAVENHHKWADAAKYLGCHSIRVNAQTKGVGTYDEQQKRAADGLAQLSEYCGRLDLNCIVENHGGLSSNGAWLAGVMRRVNRRNCGTLPDFGNFELGDGKSYDRYQGVREMMPWAKAVSAKTMNFDAKGNCVETDYYKMIPIVMKAGYHKWLGIEYEGDHMSEPEGIRATKLLLESVRIELMKEQI